MAESLTTPSTSSTQSAVGVPLKSSANMSVGATGDQQKASGGLLKAFLFPALVLAVLALLVAFPFKFVPNSFSDEEIHLLQFIPAVWPPLAVRFVSVLLSVIMVLGAFLLVLRETKNTKLSFAVSLPLIFAPWTFVMARHLTLHMVGLVVFVYVYLVLFAATRRNALAAFVVALLAFGAFFFTNPAAFMRYIGTDLGNQLLQLFDVRNLFFKGDFLSVFLQVPKTGYFMYLDVVAFFLGLSYLMDEKQAKLRALVLDVLVASVVWFAIYPIKNIATYPALSFLFAISLVVGAGYFSLYEKITALKGGAKYVLTGLILVLFGGGVLFYQNMFYGHFDRRVSHEWGYGEQAALREIAQRAGSMQKIYVSPGGTKLMRYTALVPPLRPLLTQLSNDEEVGAVRDMCLQKGTMCVLKQDELEGFGVTAEETEKVYYFGGLPAYFLIVGRE